MVENDRHSQTMVENDRKLHKCQTMIAKDRQDVQKQTDVDKIDKI